MISTYNACWCLIDINKNFWISVKGIRRQVRIWAPVYEYEIKVTHTAYESFYLVHVYHPNHVSVYVCCAVSVPSSVYVFCIWVSVSAFMYVSCLCLRLCTSSSKPVDVSFVLISVIRSVIVSVHNFMYVFRMCFSTIKNLSSIMYMS